MNSFVSALLQICQEEGNTETVESIRNQAFQKLMSGEGSALISSSLNGKSFSKQMFKTADVMFSETSEAIRIFNNGGAPIRNTTVDFSGI